jgi:hypothetical protein
MSRFQNLVVRADEETVEAIRSLHSEGYVVSTVVRKALIQKAAEVSRRYNR